MNNQEIILTVKNVDRSFTETGTIVEVLANASMDLFAGELLSVMGTSGSGKSTLLHILGGMDHPTKGSVFYRGRDIFQFDTNALNEYRRKKIAFIYQFHHLLPEFSALENVMMPSWICNDRTFSIKNRAEELLQKVGLQDRMLHLPSELSGGERQRVAVARALMNQPEVIFADEPTGNLDHKNAGYVFDLLCNLCVENNVSVVLVTHDSALSSKTNRRVVLHEGRILDWEEAGELIV
jgi:lipoprotein-releasing system ATP-binding protein